MVVTAGRLLFLIKLRCPKKKDFSCEDIKVSYRCRSDSLSSRFLRKHENLQPCSQGISPPTLSSAEKIPGNKVGKFGIKRVGEGQVITVKGRQS